MPSKAAWSSTDSTPPLGLPMGGRGPRFAPGTHILDPLAAQVLVLEDTSGSRTLWVSMDMIGMSWQMTARFRHELSALTGIPFHAIVINFSHTHSGPMSGFEGYATTVAKTLELEAYETGLIPGVAKMAVDALSRLQPVTVRVHRGASDIGINRRNRNAAGEMVMAPNPDGFINRDLWVLDIAAKSGSDRCVLFNYGCHPVIVYGFDWDGISADYPGVCRNHLVETLGPNTHAQFVQGLAGNVRPGRLADPDSGTFRKSTPEDPRAVGRELADDILALLEADGEQLDLDLVTASDFAMVPRNLSAVPPAEHWEQLRRSEDELERNLGDYWSERLASGIPPCSFVPWAIGLIRLAPGHTVAWLANEVLSEWLPLLREWLGDPNLIAWGYCQDGRNYMPTDALIAEGGYEVDRSNTYNKTGPGPFAMGINEAARKTVEGLAHRVGLR